MSSLAYRMEIRDIFSLLWRRKWFILIPVPLVSAIAFAGSYLIAPQYQSSTIIQIDPQIQLISDLQRLIGQPNGGSGRTRNRGDALRSMYNEITSLNFVGLLDARTGSANDPHIEAQAQAYLQLQPGLSHEMARSLVLQKRLKGSVSIAWASGDQVEIIVTSTSATQARDIANYLGEIFVAEKLRKDLDQIRSSQDFSDAQLEKYELQVRERMADVTEVEQMLARLRSSSATTTGANRSEIEDEIDQTDTEIEDLRQEERNLLFRLRDVEGLNTSELEIDDSEASRNANQELLSRLDHIGDILSRYIWSAPQVINFKLRQNELLAHIESENELLVDQKFGELGIAVRRRLTGLFDTRARLDYLYTKRPYLESALDNLAPATDFIPQYQAQLVQLRARLQVATDVRDQFRRQIESSSISQALVMERSVSNYRRVDPAKLPLGPFKPNRRMMLVFGFLAGLAIGGAAVFLMEIMDDSFRKVEEVEEVLGLRVLGVSPKTEFGKRVTW